VAATVAALKDVGIEVSLFIGAEAAQIEAAHAVGAPVVELHTGAFANAWLSPAADEELARLRAGCELAHRLGLVVNAGHGINYDNIRAILTLPHLHELNIGHTIVARSLLTGARAAVAEMKAHLLRGA
jgi:pyridoxine 5-phosphate synthase